MRKMYRVKRRACALCKPNKRGWDKRWKPKEEAAIRRFERERQGALRGSD